MVYFLETSSELTVISPQTGESVVLFRDKYQDYDMIAQFCKDPNAEFDFIKSLTQGRMLSLDYGSGYTIDEDEFGNFKFKCPLTSSKVPLYLIEFLKKRESDINFKKILKSCMLFLVGYASCDEAGQNKVDNYFINNDWVLTEEGCFLYKIEQNTYTEVIPAFYVENEDIIIDVPRKKIFRDSIISTYKPKIIDFENIESLNFDVGSLISDLEKQENRVKVIKEHFRVYEQENIDYYMDFSDEDLVRIFIEGYSL